jgi:hypothetical protein
MFTVNLSFPQCNINLSPTEASRTFVLKRCVPRMMCPLNDASLERWVTVQSISYWGGRGAEVMLEYGWSGMQRIESGLFDAVHRWPIQRTHRSWAHRPRDALSQNEVLKIPYGQIFKVSGIPYKDFLWRKRQRKKNPLSEVGINVKEEGFHPKYLAVPNTERSKRIDEQRGRDFEGGVKSR